MTNTNYLASIVKVLELPKQRLFQNNILKTEFRVFLPQMETSKILHLVIWGELSHRFFNIIRPNDYILIEGSLFFSNLEETDATKFIVTVSKIYPIFLTVHRSLGKAPEESP